MNYTFVSLDELLKSCEVKIINFLYDYSLLDRWSLDVKKVLLYFMVHELNDVLKNRRTLVYHTHQLLDDHELLEYYSADDLNKFLNKLCTKIRKITKRLFFIKDCSKINTDRLSQLDGEVLDEIILLDNQEPDLKQLRDFLNKHRLSDMFRSIH
jgi:hypothetical protein